jgi:hypothetical protein
MKEMLDGDGDEKEEGGDGAKQSGIVTPQRSTPPPPPPPPSVVVVDPQGMLVHQEVLAAAGGPVTPAAESATAGDLPPARLEPTGEGECGAGAAEAGEPLGPGSIAAVAESIVERVKAYLAKQKETAVNKLRECLEDRVLGYDAVLEARRRMLEVPHLLGGPAAPELGSMLSSGDGRLLHVIMDVSIGQNKVVTSTAMPLRV